MTITSFLINLCIIIVSLDTHRFDGISDKRLIFGHVVKKSGEFTALQLMMNIVSHREFSCQCFSLISLKTFTLLQKVDV